jgi:outer membrane biogenesis lipoprotein LolB
MSEYKMNSLLRIWALALLMMLTACATTNRADYESDCEHAKAHHQEMQESVRTYYALGTTGVAEIAIAERRLKRAKEAMDIACSEETNQ